MALTPLPGATTPIQQSNGLKPLPTSEPSAAASLDLKPANTNYEKEIQIAQAKEPLVKGIFGSKKTTTIPLPERDGSGKIIDLKPAKDKAKTMAGSLFRKLGKEFMKPVGVTAEQTEGLGTAIGTMLRPLVTKDISFSDASKKAINELVKAQQDSWDVLTGKKETSFSDKIMEMEWRKADPILQKTDKAFALGADLVLDPLWVMKPVKTAKAFAEARGLNVAATALKEKAKLTTVGKVINSAFNTATADKSFMDVVKKFRNLKEYREGKMIDKAIEMEKDLSKLRKTYPDADKLITNALESTDELKKITDEKLLGIVNDLKVTYKDLLSEAKRVGLKVGEIREYAPHIRTKESFKNAVKETALGAKEFGKGAIEKGRKLKGTQQELIDKGIDIFEKNPAIQLVKKGQQYAKAITSKEFANSVSKFALKEGGVPVKNPMLKGLNFLEDQARIIDNYYTGIKPEEIKVAIKGFDYIQNIWKAQALVAPSYHIRNIAGNLWNNFLAGTNPFMYGKAMAMQLNPTKYTKVIDEMKQLGVIDQGWYAKDIAEHVINQVKGVRNVKVGLNPLSMQNYVFKGNRAIGSAIENNARIAHYLDRVSKGDSKFKAAESVKKFLFDYGDLTPAEKNIFKRIFPFYTWTRKNIPLQLGQMITKPAKFAVPHKIIDNIEAGVEQPNEKFMSMYLQESIPIRVRTNKNGETEYFMLGSWLPYASAIDVLSQPIDTFLSMMSPLAKIPIEQITNTSLFFKNTLGERNEIEAYPGQREEIWTPVTGQTVLPKKLTNVLRNIRVLNDINRWIDSNDPTKTKDSWQVKLISTLIGRAGTYNIGKSKYFYDKDTDDHIRGLESAIKDAQKKGYIDVVQKLQQELIEFRKERMGME